MQRSIVDFPEPDGPGDHDRGAAFDLEIDPVEDEVVAEALADAVELDQAPVLRGSLHRRGDSTHTKRSGGAGHRDGSALAPPNVGAPPHRLSIPLGGMVRCRKSGPARRRRVGSPRRARPSPRDADRGRRPDRRRRQRHPALPDRLRDRRGRRHRDRHRARVLGPRDDPARGRARLRLRLQPDQPAAAAGRAGARRRGPDRSRLGHALDRDDGGRRQRDHARHSRRDGRRASTRCSSGAAWRSRSPSRSSSPCR